jgi:hypothetical protein
VLHDGRVLAFAEAVEHECVADLRASRSTSLPAQSHYFRITNFGSAMNILSVPIEQRTRGGPFHALCNLHEYYPSHRVWVQSNHMHLQLAGPR